MGFWELLRQILGKLIADEIAGWFPKLSRHLLQRALDRLPEDQRQEYAKQWNDEFLDQPANVAPMIYALRKLRESTRLHPGVPLRTRLLRPLQRVVYRVSVWVSAMWDRIFDLFRFGGGMWFMDLFNYDPITPSASWTSSLSVDLGNTTTSTTPSKR